MTNKITCIKQNKSNPKYSVFINNEFAFSITGTDVLYFKLKENETISEEKLEFIINNIVFNEAKDKAINFLGYKARTYKEVISKLYDENYTEEIVNKVMEMLTKYSYVDDYKYATLYTKHMYTSKLYGKIRIKYELKQKGIQQNIIEKAIAEANFDEIESIVKLFNKKLKHGNTELDYKEKKKVFDYMARRGFAYEDISVGFEVYKEEVNHKDF